MKQIPDAAVQDAVKAYSKQMDYNDNHDDAVKAALTAALPHLRPVDVAAVRRQAFEEAYKRAAEIVKKSLEVSEDYAWDEAEGIHHLIMGLIDTHPNAISALSAEPAQGKQYDINSYRDLAINAIEELKNYANDEDGTRLMISYNGYIEDLEHLDNAAPTMEEKA